MRAGHLTLPLIALLALAACDNGASEVQRAPEPTASQADPSVAGAGGADEADDPAVSGTTDDEGDTNDPGVSGGGGDME